MWLGYNWNARIESSLKEAFIEFVDKAINVFLNGIENNHIFFIRMSGIHFQKVTNLIDDCLLIFISDMLERVVIEDL